MKCRRLVGKNLVWFGSYGKDSDGHALFYNDGKPHQTYNEQELGVLGTLNFLKTINRHDNYTTKQDGVANSLTQRLSVIQGELWFAINYGFPLTNSNLSKGVYDAYVTSRILEHPEVKDILQFTSLINNHSYECKVLVSTIYGNIEINSAQSY